MGKKMLWGNHIMLGGNRWLGTPPHSAETMPFEPVLWRELTERMADAGLNLLVLELGDGVRYASHPELAAKNAWSPEQLQEEVGRLRGLGLEPVPELNFSAAHDDWLKGYSRQVSTPVYYEACEELITEVAALFGNPRFFHLGMDEEDMDHQQRSDHVTIRQHELWWHDLQFLADIATRQGCRPWVWADYAWSHPNYVQRMPKSILQSNWYYDDAFDAQEAYRPRTLVVEEQYLTYLDLDEHGYEQIPTASTWRYRANFDDTVRFCMERLDSSRILGFLQTSWYRILRERREDHLTAIEEVRKTRDRYENG